MAPHPVPRLGAEAAGCAVDDLLIVFPGQLIADENEAVHAGMRGVTSAAVGRGVVAAAELRGVLT